MAEGRLANLSVSSWVRGLDLERNGQGYGDSPLWHPSPAHDTRESQHTPGGEGTPGSTSSSGARPTPPPGHRRFGSSGSLAPAGAPPPRFSVMHTPQPGRASPVLSSSVSAGAFPPPLSLSSARPSDVLSEVTAELARLAHMGGSEPGGEPTAHNDALHELHARLAALQLRAQFEPPERWLGNNASRGDEAGCEVLVARSWEELQHFLFLDSWDDRIGKHRLRHVFRGMTNARDHKLQTSIQRLGDMEHIRTVEPAMIRAFRKYAVPEFANSLSQMRDATVWEWLTVAQHHGLPTRLLDWTHNPMIAAHFVTDRPEDLGVDGAIWCVDPAELNARCEEFRRWNLGRPLGAKVLGLFAIEQLEEYCLDCAPRHAKPGSRISSLDMFDATQLRCAFLEPPSIDARLVHQQGLFSVLSPDVDMDALLTSNPRCARKVLVPAWLKREVRDKLDAIGVSERTLFPGLDGLCTWLRRYYTKGDGRQYARGAPPPRPRLGSRQADPPPAWPAAETPPSSPPAAPHAPPLAPRTPERAPSRAQGTREVRPQRKETDESLARGAEGLDGVGVGDSPLAAQVPAGAPAHPDEHPHVVYVERAYARRTTDAWGDGL